MSTQIQTTKAPKALTLPAIFALLVLLIGFIAGCATKGEAPAPAPEASAAEAPVATEEPPALDPMIKKFGEVFSYENGVSISVSEGSPFTPTMYAAGVIPGQPALLFKIVVTNGTAAAIDPYTMETVASAGTESSAIFDMGNTDYGNVGETPMTSILPGQTIEWLVGYSVADPANLTFEVSPGFEYEQVVYTNILP